MMVCITNKVHLLACCCLATILMVGLTACTTRLGQDERDGVDVDKWQVSERDLEVARQMDAPPEVVEAMESGEWLRPSHRQMVRYAEIAIDHMATTHGQVCEARWSSTPWIIKDYADVKLVVAGGERDGTEVAVRVSSSDNHACLDDWYYSSHADSYESVIRESIATGLESTPKECWDVIVWRPYITAPIADETPISDAIPLLRGTVDVYLGPRAVVSQSQLDVLSDKVSTSLASLGYWGSFYLTVLAEEPKDGVMTADFGADACGSKENILFRSQGIVRGE